jgi:hypothetical protein
VAQSLQAAADACNNGVLSSMLTQTFAAPTGTGFGTATGGAATATAAGTASASGTVAPKSGSGRIGVGMALIGVVGVLGAAFAAI